MRFRNGFKKSFIWVQSHPGSSKRLEMRAVWRLLVTFENWEMNWTVFLCHLSHHTLACLEIKYLTEQTPEVEKVKGLLTRFPNTDYPKEFLDHEDIKDNLWLCKDWHEIAQNVRWQGLAEDPLEAFQIITVVHRSRLYHSRKLDEVFKPWYELIYHYLMIKWVFGPSERRLMS